MWQRKKQDAPEGKSLVIIQIMFHKPTGQFNAQRSSKISVFPFINIRVANYRLQLFPSFLP
jgi:hypothetical protein